MSLQMMFPGGRKRTIVIAATAGNVVTNLSPGSGKRWLLMRGRIVLVTDGTAVDRSIEFSATDGTNITSNYLRSSTIGASLTKAISLNENTFNASGATKDYAHTGIRPILIDGPDQFRITIDAGVAGDSYSGFFDVLEVDS